jgi:hypothetical protein
MSRIQRHSTEDIAHDKEIDRVCAEHRANHDTTKHIEVIAWDKDRQQYRHEIEEDVWYTDAYKTY